MTGGSYDMCHKCIISHCTVFYWMPQHHCIMMTSWNGNIFRVTGPLCGEFTGHRWIPLTNASDAKLWCIPWPRLSGRLNTHSRRQWFQTASRSLWRHCSDDEAFHSAVLCAETLLQRCSMACPYGWCMGCLLWDTGVNKVLAFSLCIVFNIMSYQTAM